MRRYQNAAYAREYTVARYLYKLMAYKDEYEVARLLTKPEIEAQVLAQWERPEAVSYNLHPPVLRALGHSQEAATRTLVPGSAPAARRDEVPDAAPPPRAGTHFVVSKPY